MKTKVKNSALEKYSVSEQEFYTSPELLRKLESKARVMTGRDIAVRLSETIPTAQTNGSRILVNPFCNLITHFTTEKLRFKAFMGMIYHEISHILYCDFDTATVALQSLRKGKPYGRAPILENERDKQNYEEMIRLMQIPYVANVVAHFFLELNNIFDDNHDEYAIMREYGRVVRSPIMTLRNELYISSPSVTYGVPKFEKMLDAIFYLARFGKIKGDEKILETDPDLAEIYAMKDDIDLAANTDSRYVRYSMMTMLLIKLWEPMRDAIAKKLMSKLSSSADRGSEDKSSGDCTGSGGTECGEGEGEESEECGGGLADIPDFVSPPACGDDSSDDHSDELSPETSEETSDAGKTDTDGSKEEGEKESFEDLLKRTSEEIMKEASEEMEKEIGEHSSKFGSTKSEGRTSESMKKSRDEADAKAKAKEAEEAKEKTSTEESPSSAGTSEEDASESSDATGSSEEDASESSDATGSSEEDASESSDATDSSEEDASESGDATGSSEETDDSSTSGGGIDSDESDDGSLDSESDSTDDAGTDTDGEEETDDASSVDRSDGKYSSSDKPKEHKLGKSEAEELDSSDEAVESLADEIRRSVKMDKAVSSAESEQAGVIAAEAESVLKGTTWHKNITANINRHVGVTETMKERYKSVMDDEAKRTVRKLVKKVSEAIKEATEEDERRCLTHGPLIIAHEAYRRDKRFFAERRLPSDTPNIALSVLVDESGSMGGERIIAARKAATIAYEFATSLGIPTCVTGHTASFKKRDCLIYNVYTDFDNITGNDKYRLMNISAREDNRDGAALQIAAAHLLKRPEPVKMMIVISDGAPLHSQAASLKYSGEAANEDVRTIVKGLKKKGMDIICYGIGGDKPALKKMYGEESFVDISCLDTLPSKMAKLIKKRIEKEI